VGWGDAFVDFNNNGWQDFFLVNGHVYPQVDEMLGPFKYLEPKLLFLNQRNGTFKECQQISRDRNPGSAGEPWDGDWRFVQRRQTGSGCRESQGPSR
jgi:hypothetical protein